MIFSRLVPGTLFRLSGSDKVLRKESNTKVSRPGESPPAPAAAATVLAVDAPSRSDRLRMRALAVDAWQGDQLAQSALERWEKFYEQ